MCRDYVWHFEKVCLEALSLHSPGGTAGNVMIFA
jgi:hypothetical protein